MALSKNKEELVGLDERGYMTVESENGTQLRMCPWTEDERYCGTWCPLFERLNATVTLHCGGTDVVRHIKDGE